MITTLQTEQKRTLLLRYLNQYLSKRGLLMVNIIRSIRDRVLRDQPMTPKQFNSIIKFIEREREFLHLNRDQITTYFEPFIFQPPKEEPNESNDLTVFFESQTDQLQRTDLPH